MAFTLATLDALEILDSRSRPTLAVTLSLTGGPMVEAGVPSGASTGSGEAVELRDGDPQRFGGLGVRIAAANVTGEIADALIGRTFGDLAELDAALIALDGTVNKSRLGANAIVGVSIAAARATAQSSNQPLWSALCPTGVLPRLPVPHFNVVNGGVHAPNELDFQEFMIAPVGAPSIAEAVRRGPRSTARYDACCRTRDSRPGSGTRVGSPRRSPNPKTSWTSSCRPSRPPDTSQVARVSRLRWTRPPASSTTTAGTTSRVKPSRPTRWSLATKS